MKKENSILFFLLLIFSCASTKNGNTKYLSLIQAEKKSFVLGRERENGQSAGTSYVMYFKSSEKLKIDKIWIKKTNIDFEQLATDAKGSFKLTATFYNANQENIHTDVVEPIHHNGKALIQYIVEGETKYFIVKDFMNQENGKLAK